MSAESPLKIPAVSRETEQKLRLYHDILLKWQARINLISPATVNTIWNRHIEDSLQLLPLLPQGPFTLYDMGSGAGFPGLVLAMARPDMALTLIESDSKKCAFLTAVSRETSTAVTIRNSRIEAAAADLPAPDCLSARALAPLSDLLDLAAPWVAANPALTALFPKGEQYGAEITAAREKGWVFDAEAHKSATESRARILRLTQIGRAI